MLESTSCVTSLGPFKRRHDLCRYLQEQTSFYASLVSSRCEKTDDRTRIIVVQDELALMLEPSCLFLVSEDKMFQER